MLQAINRSEKALVAGAALFSLAMVALAIAGGINSYSPIPFWDMWNSVVAFMNELDGETTPSGGPSTMSTG